MITSNSGVPVSRLQHIFFVWAWGPHAHPVSQMEKLCVVKLWPLLNEDIIPIKDEPEVMKASTQARQMGIVHEPI